MKLLKNTANERVIDALKPTSDAAAVTDVASQALTLAGLVELAKLGVGVNLSKLVIPESSTSGVALMGGASERSFRNRLVARCDAGIWLRKISEEVSVKLSPLPLPQSTWVVRQDSLPKTVITGNCPLTTSGLGTSPPEPLSLVQMTESPEEAAAFSGFFDMVWRSVPDAPDAARPLLDGLREIAAPRSARELYALVLQHCLGASSGDLDEDAIVKSATGIKDTVVWQKLFKFQRDGVIGAIDKLNRYGGCIIADSVGLGKTFEALAVIKYHELRNDRVLVLAPKRLRDNWTLYKSNDQRNILSRDRFHYDVLNHTDLSRKNGKSGDIDLEHVQWGNYNLVVIDESHNFRNKPARNDRLTRYSLLMERIIKAGVKTKVLMLSATPVNNRLADLRNQIAFITEGKDTALEDHGIASLDATIRKAQMAFNSWLLLPAATQTAHLLVEMLGFDYFTLLDLVTIARSRKHIEKYYGTEETGKFPNRLPPANYKPDVDRAGEFRSVKEINTEIRKLTLAAYAPLRYVFEHKQADYDEKYSTKLQDGHRIFRQLDREESLIHLLRVNVLKRMESAVSSFALTVSRQLRDVDATLARLAELPEAVEEISIEDVDIDDPTFESLLVGNKVKVLLRDIDLLRWRQDLEEDRNRLYLLLTAAQQVDAARDAKLEKLQQIIREKVRQPLNPGNKKVLIFTAFADTAIYLYDILAPWAQAELGLHTALVTGSGKNQTTVPKLRKDLASILTAFSPRSKERPAALADDGEIDLLIATDCISEGQNLQDCDFLVNYDIHWNPVRIIQRFGRIDRIGSINTDIQLVNFWPNMELAEYLDLEKRVTGRMVLLDVSATGEENLIDAQAGNEMNDLEYRRNQLLQLQERVLDLEDLSGGVSITDMTLTDFRIDLGDYRRSRPGVLESLPLGTHAVTTSPDAAVPPGVVFCLRAEGDAAGMEALKKSHPMFPHFLVHVAADSTVLLEHTKAKLVFDLLRRAAAGRDAVDSAAYAAHDRATGGGADMAQARRMLAAALANITGKQLEKSTASLFTPGGTTVGKGDLGSLKDFEVVAFLILLPHASS